VLTACEIVLKEKEMRRSRFSNSVFQLCAISLFLISNCSWIHGQDKTVLYSFTNGTDGGLPFAGLTSDETGALYGTTSYGGNIGCQQGGNFCGTVFKLSPPSQSGGVWTETTIYTFGNSSLDEGSTPKSAVVFDPKGNLYGTTSSPTNSIYQLGPGSNGTWSSNWLYSSRGALLTPIVDSQGNVYDSDNASGSLGTVFQLSPNSDGTFTTNVIHTFEGGADGSYPGGLVMDGEGRIFGLTAGGGDLSCNPTTGCGTVFALLPPAKRGGVWTHYVLFNFEGSTNGASPYFPLALDANHNLYGIALGAGSQSCPPGICAMVFELSPPAKLGGAWTETVIHTFQGGNDAAYPQGTLVLDSHGSLYGTSIQGGGGPCVENGALVGCGTIYRLSPPASPGGSWTEAILHSFQSESDGSQPYGSVVLDEAKRTLYGTSAFGGPENGGTVFQITP
jgi:hypothetical protein